jgi:hypothetical protein
MLLKIKDSTWFVWQKRTDFGGGKVLIFGKKRSLLTFFGAILSLLHSISGG